MIVECAPIAGYTDQEFRRALIKAGAKVVYTEMVSVAALYFNKPTSKPYQKTLELLKFDPTPGVKTIVQIFGKDPKHFEHAIISGVLDGFDEININMGCPANKIIKNGEGVALMSKPVLAREIIETCVKAASDSVRSTQVPVSVKMRLGVKITINKEQLISFARMCESAGANRLIVHGRYGEQGYGGAADWDTIGEVVRAVSIPVIANGDIRDRASAEKCLSVTGAAGVMVGRALLNFKKFDVVRKQYVINEQGLTNFWRDYLCGVTLEVSPRQASS